MTEDKMENGYELWLKCCDNTKSGEVRRFLEVPTKQYFNPKQFQLKKKLA